MVESPDFSGSGARHSGLQSLRRSPAADRADDGDVRRAARRSAGRRLPHLHLHYDAALRARRGGARTARRCGFSIDRIPSAVRSRGLRCAPGWESFVGAGPMPMRHGLTMGELAHWFVATLRSQGRLPSHRDAGLEARRRTRLRLAARRARLDQSEPERADVCRPRAATPARSWSKARRCRKAAARRGRSRSFGAPDHRCRGAHRHDARARAAVAARLPAARVLVRADVPEARRQALRRRADSRRRRVVRARRRFGRGAGRRSRSRRCGTLEPKYPLWRDFPYEYESGRLAIDVINGSDLLRHWVDDRRSTPDDLDAHARADERAWSRERKPFLLY